MPFAWPDISSTRLIIARLAAVLANKVHPMQCLRRMAKVTLVHQAPGDDQPQELPVFLSDKGKLHMPSVCRMLGLSLVQLDGVLVPEDATYSPATYDPDARIEVSGFQLAAGRWGCYQ